MPLLRHLPVLFAFLAAFVRPAPASAFTPSSPGSRLGGFEVAAHLFAGELGAASREQHHGIDAAYDENASGYRFAAGSARKLLPAGLRVPLGNAKYGLEHILRRHVFTSGAEGASKFARGMGHIEIRGLINEAAHSGAAFEIQGGSRVLNVGMGRIIGTDLAGSATSGLRVVTDASGNVITAYPIPWP